MKSKNKILSVETSSSLCGVCLSEGDNPRALVEYEGGNIHDRFLAELVRRTISDFGVSADELDALAISCGPGSFTGLRIGAAFAKGFCFGGDPKLIAVPTLTAAANYAAEFAQATGAAGIFALAASHKNLSYLQIFEPDGNPKSEIELLENEEILRNINKETLLCGAGATIFDKGIKLGRLSRFSAEFVAKVSLPMFDRGEFTSASEFAPLYVQEFQPKTKKS